MSIETTAGENLWVQKYRPLRVADTILPPEIKTKLQAFVDSGNIPNLLLAGSAGTGKTTAALAMCNELDVDSLLINASKDNGIDVLRTKIFNFASSVSLSGGRKIVILDEADYLSPSAQPALRGLIEEVSKNCGFILTCNFKNRLIEPIHSRFGYISFSMSKDQSITLQAEFFKRVMQILKNESVKANPKVVATIIQKYFPDFRRILNELQLASASGDIDESSLINPADESVDHLFKILKAKDFTQMRKWCADNSDIGATEIFRKLFDHAVDHVESQSLPEFIVQLGEYQYKHAFVADPEINMAAFLTTIMIEVDFK